MATMKKPAKKMQMGGMADSYTNYKMGGTVKAKNGKSFPDLNKDGKITKADILKGRGVIAKKGMKVKKAQGGDSLSVDRSKAISDITKKAAGSVPTPEKRSIPRPASMMKKGGKMTKKCKYGCK